MYVSFFVFIRGLGVDGDVVSLDNRVGLFPGRSLSRFQCLPGLDTTVLFVFRLEVGGNLETTTSRFFLGFLLECRWIIIGLLDRHWLLRGLLLFFFNWVRLLRGLLLLFCLLFVKEMGVFDLDNSRTSGLFRVFLARRASSAR